MSSYNILSDTLSGTNRRTFENHRNENNVRFFYDYIDENINRLNRKNRTDNSLRQLSIALEKVWNLETEEDRSSRLWDLPDNLFSFFVQPESRECCRFTNPSGFGPGCKCKISYKLRF